MAEGERIQVTVLYSPAAREVLEWELALAPGATVLQALQASGLPAGAARGYRSRMQPSASGGARPGWIRCLWIATASRSYRPLRVDPKLARRERFKKQGTRGAGLFASRRPGAKPGY